MGEVIQHEPQRPQTEVATTVTTPAQLLAMAVQQGAGLDQLEKLMGLHERWEANEAKKAFDEAVAEFKANPPKVYRDKENKQYGSRYASLANLVNTVNSELSVHGLNARWEADQTQQIQVTCILSHVRGHSERVSLQGPPDTSGAKNTLQQIKSTLTYLKLATFELVTGVASEEGNLDDDGNGAGMPEKDSTWIAKAEIMTDFADYQKAKATMVKEYGGVNNVPQAVRVAFNKAAAETKPKD